MSSTARSQTTQKVLLETPDAVAKQGSTSLAERAGWYGIVGGVIWFVSGIVGMFVPQLYEPGTAAFLISGVLATITLGLLLFGFLGIAWGDALGGRIGKAFFGVAVLGYALMLVGALQTIAGVGPLLDPEAGVALIYLLGRLIAALFALLTGIAVLTARRWRGWAALTPLLVGLCPLVGELGFVVAFGQPNLVLNAAWGIFSALLGLATLAQARSHPRSTSVSASAAA